MNFDEKDDEDFNKDFDEELEPEEKPIVKKPAKEVKSKTPAAKVVAPKGKKASVYVISTIGPGEKKQKLLIDTGNRVEAIKKTVGNIFGLDPDDFHLSSGGVTLDENSPISDYDISDGDEILLIPASTAGIY